jgi:hypothetical protein
LIYSGKCANTNARATLEECQNAKVDLLLSGMFPNMNSPGMQKVRMLLPSPRSRPTLLDPFQLARRPASIKVPRLRLNLLVIDKALPRHSRRVEGQIPLDILERGCRSLVTPDLTVDLVAGGIGSFDGPVCGLAFPFTEGGLVGDLGEGDGGVERGAGKIVG